MNMGVLVPELVIKGGRVVDPAQAQMMSGFVAWHVIGHQRRFATYQAQQREERWQRLGPRRAQDVPVGILGFGEIGRRVAIDLALLGFPVMAWSRKVWLCPAAFIDASHSCCARASPRLCRAAQSAGAAPPPMGRSSMRLPARPNSTPTRRISPGCSACATSGHAAEPPIAVINSRRRI